MKLSAPRVAQIKRLVLDGWSLTDIGAAFGITKTHVATIRDGGAWTDIAPNPIPDLGA